MQVTAITDAISFEESSSEPVLWWSFGKTCLSAATLVLVSRGSISLDESPDGKDYSIRQLLQHTAGFPDYGELPEYHKAVKTSEKAWSEAELVNRIASLPFRIPGTSWRYSNFGYLRIRRLIEQITNQNIESALNDLVFNPLNISGIRLANRTDLEKMGLENYDPDWVYHGLFVGSSGNAVRFLHGLMTEHLVPQTLLAEMTAPYALNVPMGSRPWKSPAYGLGLMIDSNSSRGRAYGHTGQGPGSVFAAYHFSDLRIPKTAAIFETGGDQAKVENDLIELVF